MHLVGLLKEYKNHSASYRIGTEVLSPGPSGGVVRVTTHLHLIPRLTMSGEIFLFPLRCFKRVQQINRLAPELFFFKF